MSNRAAIALSATGLLLGLLLLLGSSSKPSSQTSTGQTRPHIKGTADAPLAQPPGIRTPPSSTQTSPPHPVAFVPRANHRAIEQQDAYLRSAHGKRQLRQQKQLNPAYQHLPYRTDGVRIEITNVTSDGRVVLRVIPLGLNVNPRIAYTRFLHRYHDPGSAYLALFARYGT
jgi:hypothetical protein